jgi:hypothetical protein
MFEGFLLIREEGKAQKREARRPIVEKARLTMLR